VQSKAQSKVQSRVQSRVQSKAQSKVQSRVQSRVQSIGNPADMGAFINNLRSQMVLTVTLK
jgi:hypothetical protein